MKASDLRRALDTAVSTASSLGLAVHYAVVLRDSTKLTLRLIPCDVVARVAHSDGLDPLELRLARQLADIGCPVVGPERMVDQRIYERAGFAIAFWTYYEAATLWPTYEAGAAGADLSAAYAAAMARLHAGMRTVDFAPPHFMDWVSGALRFLRQRGMTPMLTDAEVELLSGTLVRLSRSVGDHDAPEQVLHGEPHPDNVLLTDRGPLFIDWDTPCRGPVEYDLAYVPAEVAALYPDADERLVQACRGLALVRVALCRCEPDDQLPNREQELASNLRALRGGPPWPTLDALDRAQAGGA